MIVVSVIAALCAAVSNSLASYFQQGADKRLPSDESVPLSQVPKLVTQPRWLLGQVFDVSAFLLQAVALAFGTLVFVEPLLAMSLPVTVGVRSWSARRWPGRLGVGGSLLSVTGMAAFLAAARPIPGGSTITGGEIVALGVSVAVLLGGTLAAAALTHGNTRAVAFAAGAATVYGVTAGLTKVVTGELQSGAVLEPLLHWPLYTAIATGITGVLLTQNALKPGALAVPVAVITMGDPLVGITIGLLWLGETVTSAPWAIAVEVITVLVMAAGVVLLAHQSESASVPTGEDDARQPSRT
jgi:hypothetical protein